MVMDDAVRWLADRASEATAGLHWLLLDRWEDSAKYSAGVQHPPTTSLVHHRAHERRRVGWEGLAFASDHDVKQRQCHSYTPSPPTRRKSHPIILQRDGSLSRPAAEAFVDMLNAAAKEPNTPERETRVSFALRGGNLMTQQPGASVAAAVSTPHARPKGSRSRSPTRTTARRLTFASSSCSPPQSASPQAQSSVEDLRDIDELSQAARELALVDELSLVE